MNKPLNLSGQDYQERLKELTCLYETGIKMRTFQPLDSLCMGLIEDIRAAMRFPEIAVPVIRIDNLIFSPDNYSNTLKHRITAEIKPFGEPAGSLSVYYTQDKPFHLPQEQNLINHIAWSLSLWLENKKSEERMVHLNNVLKAIRNVNQMIVREKDRDRLIQKACDTLVESRGYFHVWIALLDPDNSLLRFVHAGLGDKASALHEKLSKKQMPDCAKRLFSGGKTAITTNPAKDCAGCILQPLYTDRSNIKGRLEYDAKSLGIISVSVPMQMAADPEEIELFEELTEDISFALYNIQREQQLTEERKRLEYILAITRTGIDIIDPQFNLKYVDPGWQNIYGNPEGRKCYEYFMGQDNPCAGCGIPEALRTRQTVITEEVLPRENNRIIQVHTIPFEDPDGNWLVAEFNVDITDRKQAQQLIEAKNRELEQIVYVASHDLRSPLVNVDGYSRELGFAVEEIQKAMDAGTVENAVHNALPEMTGALQHIRNSTRQMDALLKGLLKLSRTGRAALTIATLDMNELISRILSSIEFQIKESGTEMNLSDLPPCLGDEVQVTQVFSNLINNALKYRDPDRKGIITISGTVEDFRSTYCVEDNGIGIAPEHQESIFELFHRLDPSSSQGEGLGLTLVRQILGRINGDIRVESTTGTGSRFYVTLPYAFTKKEE